ncbi:hypothetical protein AB0M46_47440 [Dactylosporangium sp. NPDC051485]|uniref:hypothetical protein n=1 Tax=Dactylosporangium sp. NPDC051485 TaxID=3154846 RepID=UPI00343E6856
MTSNPRHNPTRDAPTDPATAAAEPAAAGNRWQHILTASRDAGADAGRAAAEWWAQDTIGGRATGDMKVTARRVLTGIDDGDPAVLDNLPRLDRAARHTGSPTEADVYRDTAGADAPDWPALTGAQQQQAVDAYRDAFDTAATDRVTELCRRAASPTGDGRDLSHLHPGQLRIGSIGVFACEWSRYDAEDGADRIDVGYVGTLADTWNGSAVFRCTRTVAEAIVAEHEHSRREYQQRMLDDGLSPADVENQVNAELAILAFDGDEVVADLRLVQDDPTAINRTGPDADGRYAVMGRIWQWYAVDPDVCDRIVGDLPAPGAHQQYVILPHTQLRVPHDRLRVTALQQMSTHHGVAFTATVAFDAVTVGSITNDGNGGATEPYVAHPRFGWRELAAYVAACRRSGAPATEEQVLDALVEEYDTAELIRDATAAGTALVRLRDEDGNTLDLHIIRPVAARDPATVADLTRHLTEAHPHPSGTQWEIWAGTGWRVLGRVHPTSTDRTAHQP